MIHNYRVFAGTAILLVCLISVINACSDQQLFPEETGSELENIGGQNLWTSLDKGEQIYPYRRVDDEIFCGSYFTGIQPMKNTDSSTFEVWPESGYARDSLNVYYPIETIQYVAEDTLLVTECTNYTVKGVEEPFNFRYLGRGYGTDNLNLFLRGRLIENF